MLPNSRLPYWENVRRLARLAELAYDRCGIAAEGVDCWHWKQDNAKGFCLSNRETVVVSIAGTNDMLDSSLNRHCWSEFAFHSIHVHGGFNVHAALVASALREYDFRGREVWLTGHSAGGAVAGILPFRPEFNLSYSKLHIVGFNAPKFVTSKSARFYQHSYHNICNPYDCVPDLPVRWWNGRNAINGWPSYSMVGRKYFVYPDGTVDTEASGVNRRIYRWSQLGAGLVANWTGLSRFQVVKNHIKRHHDISSLRESLEKVPEVAS